MEYRIEGFDMFDQMVDSIRESSVKMLLTIELRAAGSAPTAGAGGKAHRRGVCARQRCTRRQGHPQGASRCVWSKLAATTLAPAAAA